MGGSSSGISPGGSVSRQQASDDWFEYENANVMAEYVRTGRMPSENMYGERLSAQDKRRLKAEADYIQAQAESTNSGYNTLYRGMVLSESEARSITPGSDYTMRTITATSPDRKVSSIYADVEKVGGEGVPVMFEIQQSGGIKGFKASPVEVILPKGASFKVFRNFMDKDGMVHISLYRGKRRK